MTLTLPSGAEVEFADLAAIDAHVERIEGVIEQARADRAHLVRLRRKLKPESIVSPPAEKPAAK